MQNKVFKISPIYINLDSRQACGLKNVQRCDKRDPVCKLDNILWFRHREHRAFRWSSEKKDRTTVHTTRKGD